MTSRILQIAPSVPHAAVPHAGGRFQLQVVQAQQEAGAHVMLLVPSYPATRRDIPRAPEWLRVVDPERGLEHGVVVSLLLRASHRLLALAARSPLPWLHPPFIASLLLSSRVRRLLRGADVIDLQWYEMVTLAPLIRAIAGRRPRLIGTFHDVMSQRMSRRAEFESAPEESRRFQRLAQQHRRLEKFLARWLDTCLVLSSKDADLLIDSGIPPYKVQVVNPLVQVPASATDTPPPSPRTDKVLVVGFLMRHENIDAAQWVISEMWPTVLAAVPGAELHVIGDEAPDRLNDLAKNAPRVVMRGYVDDLWTEYRQAACNVVALRDGAGVKFKTIESIIAGVPTVATPIGAEGVADPSSFVTISEDPAELAQGIIAALTDPREAEHARDSARRITDRHGATAFSRTIRRIYLGDPARPAPGDTSS